MTLADLLKLAPEPPPLPAPCGKVVRVTNSAGLVRAFQALECGTTILLADGLYTPPPDLCITRDDVTLRGESGGRERVILDGGGAFSAMLRIKGARNTLIADMTFRNCLQYGIFIFGDSGAQRSHIQNVRFHNIWTRAIKGTHPQRPDDRPEPLLPIEHARRARPSGGSITHCLFDCDSAKPHDDLFGGDYISGIDMMMLKNWTISDNVFHGIRGKNGGGRGAIFIWVDSEDVRVERNLIAACDRGICFGNPSGTAPQVTRGIVRGNRILAGVNKAIELCGTVDCDVADNRVYAANIESPKTVHIFGGARGTRVRDNLIHGQLLAEDDCLCERNRTGDLNEFFSHHRSSGE